MPGSRRQAIADLYWHASRLVYREDAEAYARILDKIHALFPRYAPACRTYAGPKLASLVRWFGVRNAERLLRAFGR